MIYSLWDIFFEVETFSENEKISGRDVGGEKIKMREGDLERPSTFFQIKDFLIFKKFLPLKNCLLTHILDFINSFIICI